MKRSSGLIGLLVALFTFVTLSAFQTQPKLVKGKGGDRVTYKDLTLQPQKYSYSVNDAGPVKVLGKVVGKMTYESYGITTYWVDLQKMNPYKVYSVMFNEKTAFNLVKTGDELALPCYEWRLKITGGNSAIPLSEWTKSRR